MTTPDQPTGMNELRELDRILDSFYLGDEDKYTPEAWAKHRADAEAAVQQLVERCIPKKINDSRPNDFAVNNTIDDFRHNLQQAGLLRGEEGNNETNHHSLRR